MQVVEETHDLPVEGLMRLAEQGGALDFLNDEREEGVHGRGFEGDVRMRMNQRGTGKIEQKA